MKQRLGLKAVLLVLLIFMLSACQNHNYSLSDGRYVPDSLEDKTDAPFIFIEDDRLSVTNDIAVSYQPYGDMVVSGYKVTMETVYAGEPYKWVFKLTGNNELTFLPDESDVPDYHTKWQEEMTFILVED